MGWSEITPYTFDVYDGWEEIPVSIADPGGSEIDVRFNSETDGGLKVVLAPVLRFADVAVRISQSPHTASLIAHTRTRRDYYLCPLP